MLQNFLTVTILCYIYIYHSLVDTCGLFTCIIEPIDAADIRKLL